MHDFSAKSAHPIFTRVFTEDTAARINTVLNPKLNVKLVTHGYQYNHDGINLK